MATTTDKKRTTVYMAPDVLEFLGIRRAKGAGSVSQQLEDLVREQMPRRLSAEEVSALEARDIGGYQAQPQTQDELAAWLGEQVWAEE